MFLYALVFLKQQNYKIALTMLVVHLLRFFRFFFLDFMRGWDILSISLQYTLLSDGNRLTNNYLDKDKI